MWCPQGLVTDGESHLADIGDTFLLLPYQPVLTGRLQQAAPPSKCGGRPWPGTGKSAPSTEGAGPATRFGSVWNVVSLGTTSPRAPSGAAVQGKAQARRLGTEVKSNPVPQEP